MNADCFELFDQFHIIWLVICAAGMAASFLLPGRESEKTARIVSKMLASAVFILHLLETFFRIREGTFGIYTLPLHMCAIAAYACVIFEIFPNIFTGAVLFFPCLPGDIAAILFPDWRDCPPFSVLSVLGFLGHLSIACYIIHKIRRGEIRPRMRLMPYSVLLLIVYACIMIPFNRHFGTNYGFLEVPVPGSPLEFLWEISGGGALYLGAYALFVLAVMLIWYGIWYNKDRTDRSEKE